MAKEEFCFNDFLNDISPEYTDIANSLHNFLLESGCGLKMQLAKSGHVVSYTDVKTKRVTANLVTRKKGPVVRIYGDNSYRYMDLFETLPDGMVKAISKSPDCKRLTVDPAKCNQKCPMGYTLTIKDVTYKKCRYNGLMFDLNTENAPYVKAILENEIRERNA